MDDIRLLNSHHWATPHGQASRAWPKCTISPLYFLHYPEILKVAYFESMDG
jgi:hypothetical protein